jgi:hypothetical protein
MRVPTLAALGSFLGPFLGSLNCLSSDAVYRADVAILRRFGAVPVVWGSPGVALAMPFDLLPFGDMQVRAGLPSALAAGFSGLLLFLGTLRLLQSFGASLAACLGFPFLAAGSLLGSGAVGAALGLLWLYALNVRTHRDRRRASDRYQAALRLLGRPATLAALFLESPPLFVALLAAEFARSVVDSRLVREPSDAPFRSLWLRRLGSALGFGLALSLFLLPQGPRLFQVDASLLAEGSTLGAGGETEHNPFHLVGEMGFVWLPAALVGIGHGLLHSPRKVLPLAVVLLVDTLLPASRELGWLHTSPDSQRAALHLVAICVWASFGALGLRTVAVAFETLQLKGSRFSGAVLTTLGVSSALAGAEDAVSLLERTERGAIRLYSERLLRELPLHSLVLGSSKVVVDRLLAAQALGERRDVLVVPEPALGQSRHVRGFVAIEPALEKLVLDLNLAGTPSEHALYQLTDKRPVFTEVSSSWDVRLLAHLIPRAGLAEYSAHSLTSSERRGHLDREESHFAGLLQASRTGIDPDVTTERLVRAHAESFVTVLSKLHDDASAERLSTLGELGGPAPATPPPNPGARIVSHGG